MWGKIHVVLDNNVCCLSDTRAKIIGKVGHFYEGTSNKILMNKNS